MESDRQYLNRRAAEEEEAAGQASSGKAREAHLELASRYREAAGADPELRVADKVKPGLAKEFRIIE
jgi:hypothetical protein